MQINSINIKEKSDNIPSFKAKQTVPLVQYALGRNQIKMMPVAAATSLASMTMALNNIKIRQQEAEVKKYINKDNIELANILMYKKGLDKSNIANILRGTVLRHPDTHALYSVSDQVQKYIEVLQDPKTSDYMVNKLNKGVSIQEALFDLELKNDDQDYYFL